MLFFQTFSVPPMTIATLWIIFPFAAVIIDVIVSSLAFTFKHAKNVNADIKINENGAKVYQRHGPLFFASTTQFKELFDARNAKDLITVSLSEEPQLHLTTYKLILQPEATQGSVAM